MADLGDLIAAAGLTPPVEPLDWASTETSLGAPVPPDYRALLDAGGAGLWFDHIRTFPPTRPREDQRLTDSVGMFADLALLWEDEVSVRPADLAPKSRVLAWADTAAGETLFWRVDPGADPTTYPIYVEDADGQRWERYDRTVTGFLAGILRGEIVSELFAEAFLDLARTDRPHTDG